MKNKILWFLFFSVLLVTQLSAKPRTINVSLEVNGMIEKKAAATFLENIRYWVKAKTPYILDKKSDLLLSVYVKQKQDKYLLEASLKEGDNILRQGHSYFGSLTDFTEALDIVFYQQIFAGEIEEKQRKYLVQPDFFDLAFILDSTGSMKEETDFFKSRMKEILSYLFWNLKTYRVRLALLDYKNMEAVYRTRITNFSEKTEEMQKHLKQIKNIGKGSSDINYALLYLLTYGNFIAPNRLIFIITDTGPADKGKFIEIMQKAEKMKTRVVFFASDGINEEDAKFFEATAKKFDGGFYHLTYFLTFVLKDYSLKSFIYQYRSLWNYEDKESRDITLGRKIKKLNEINDFVRSEGFAVQNLKEIYINLGEVIGQWTSVYKKKIPLALFQAEKKNFKIGIQDKETQDLLRKQKGKKVLIGGHFFPYFDTVSVFPYTFVVKKGNVPSFVLQPYPSFLKDPLFFYNRGLFEPSFWYTYAVFKGFE